MSAEVRVRIIDDSADMVAVMNGVASCWTEVSNAGGAVGFPFPPVSSEQVASATRQLTDEVARGSVRLYVAEQVTDVVGWVVLRLNASPLTRHWATVERLQSRPDRRGEGIGGLLLRSLYEDSRTLRIEHLRLALRGGEGLERFYVRHGWIEVGRHPGALRLSKRDSRDEVFMTFDLVADSD